MPDWTGEPIKLNPNGGVGSGNTTGDPNHPGSDWSGYALSGGPLGVIGYKTVTEILSDAGDAIANPSALNHVTGEARFTDGDTAGKYAIGHGVKYASGAAAGEPCMWFPVAGSFLDAHPSQLWVVGALFAVNGTTIPDTVDIDVGFYRLTLGGGADQITYTLNDTGKIVETYGDGIPSGPYSRPNDDRHADFATGGTQNYGLGVELHSALPADCVLDVSLSLQLSPY